MSDETKRIIRAANRLLNALDAEAVSGGDIVPAEMELREAIAAVGGFSPHVIDLGEALKRSVKR